MADVSRETRFFTVIFFCFALSSMTAMLCGLFGSASLSLCGRTMLMVAVCGLPFCCGAVAIIDLPLSVFRGQLSLR